MLLDNVFIVHIKNTLKRLPARSRRKVRMMSSPYGPYRLGYTCATMEITKRNAIAIIKFELI
jgi:hypothetical protein